MTEGKIVAYRLRLIFIPLKSNIIVFEAARELTCISTWWDIMYEVAHSNPPHHALLTSPVDLRIQ